MRVNAEISKIEIEEEYGAVLKTVASEAERAAAAVEEYGRAVQRARLDHKQPTIVDSITPGDVNTWAGAVFERFKNVQSRPRLQGIGAVGSAATGVAGLGLTADKYLRGDTQQELPTLLKYIDITSDVASSLGSLATLGSLVPAGTAVGGAAAFLAALPLGPAAVGLGGLALIGSYIHNKEQARRRAFDAWAAEQHRLLPQHIQAGLNTEMIDVERRLRETYNTLRLSNRSIVNLTGQNVDDLLKGLQDLNPRALESYFQSLREGRGEIEQLSQAQLAHIDLIEKLVVTYRALAVESDAARDAASEYADHLRPVDVIFETLAVHAGELTAQFVEQHGALQRHTQATEAQAQAARDVAAATTAQAAATERANTGEVARTRNLLRTTQHTREASRQIASATERLTDLTGALVTTDAGLATHSEHVGFVTEAYRELSAQIGDTIGDVLAGAVSFKEAWESLGRGVLDTVKHLGRQLLDSLLGSVRDMGRRLADVIFGQLHGASRGFLPPFPGDELFHSGGSWRNLVSLLSNDSDYSGYGIPNRI